jgi:hypothetical protein
VKNNVINNSQYSKLIYSSTLCTFNAIYIRFSLENYARVIHNNKIRYTFHLLENQNIINKIKHIEHHLLHQFYITYSSSSSSNFIRDSTCQQPSEKKAVYKISNQLNSGNFRVIETNNTTNTDISFIMKKVIKNQIS